MFQNTTFPFVCLFISQVQGQQTETRIKEEFKKLHQFLREEEGDRLGALWEEEGERKSEVERKMDSVDQAIQSLEEKIQQIEEEMEAEGDGLEFLQVLYPKIE